MGALQVSGAHLELAPLFLALALALAAVLRRSARRRRAGGRAPSD
jgi:hypothetical protein